jgi:hypothetical protein
MKPCKFALAALLLATAGASAAGVPVIELAAASFAQVRPALDAASAPQLVGQKASLSAPSARADIKTDSSAGQLVAVRPQPSLSALVLLALACVIYLGRRRRQGFALRPTRSLLRDLNNAPARA